MSIANRDASVQCLAQSREAFRRNDLAKALALCEKSVRLYPIEEAKTFLNAIKLKLEKERQQQQQQQRSQSSQQTSKDARSSEENDHRKHGPVRGDYTEEQQRLAVEIRSTKCYYARLGVEKNCSDIELIKKAYKKKAFQFHPDKNHAPAADDAFKAVNQAHECLTDPDRKAAYDSGGMFHPQDDVLTPEDILHMFFSGGAHGMPHRRRGHHRARPGPWAHATNANADQSASLRQLLMQFLPIILLFVFSMWSGPSSSGAGRVGVAGGEGEVFTLAPGNGFITQRTTADQGLVYYVKPQFVHWYGHDKRALARIDRLVTVSHMAALKAECTKQTQEREDAIERAKEAATVNYGDLHAAHERPLTACTKLSEIYAT
ncbi:unnamed protein product (mitochondrion) [Plasmodiophora brassicae]|uniref:J domain-containing protein n=1 Tax=Plasmodiophora brassicae TaxID=37360 RepID=A0A3P3Y407_PLABS|nr:unnamed protein product [Plasmodiophora brassicae]